MRAWSVHEYDRRQRHRAASAVPSHPFPATHAYTLENTALRNRLHPHRKFKSRLAPTELRIWSTSSSALEGNNPFTSLFRKPQFYLTQRKTTQHRQHQRHYRLGLHCGGSGKIKTERYWTTKYRPVLGIDMHSRASRTHPSIHALGGAYWWIHKISASRLQTN